MKKDDLVIGEVYAIGTPSYTDHPGRLLTRDTYQGVIEGYAGGTESFEPRETKPKGYSRRLFGMPVLRCTFRGGDEAVQLNQIDLDDVKIRPGGQKINNIMVEVTLVPSHRFQRTWDAHRELQKAALQRLTANRAKRAEVEAVRETKRRDVTAALAKAQLAIQPFYTSGSGEFNETVYVRLDSQDLLVILGKLNLAATEAGR